MDIGVMVDDLPTWEGTAMRRVAELAKGSEAQHVLNFNWRPIRHCQLQARRFEHPILEPGFAGSFGEIEAEMSKRFWRLTNSDVLAP